MTAEILRESSAVEQLLAFALRCSANNPAAIGPARNEAVLLLESLGIEPRETGVFFTDEAAELADARAALAQSPDPAGERLAELGGGPDELVMVRQLWDGDDAKAWQATIHIYSSPPRHWLTDVSAFGDTPELAVAAARRKVPAPPTDAQVVR